MANAVRILRIQISLKHSPLDRFAICLIWNGVPQTQKKREITWINIFFASVCGKEQIYEMFRICKMRSFFYNTFVHSFLDSNEPESTKILTPVELNHTPTLYIRIREDKKKILRIPQKYSANRRRCFSGRSSPGRRMDPRTGGGASPYYPSHPYALCTQYFHFPPEFWVPRPRD